LREWAVHEIDPFVAGVVFFSSLSLDALSAYFVRVTARGEAARASLVSAGIATLGYINLAAFIGNPVYALPEIMGGIAGTYLVVKFDSRRSRITSAQ
jgi:hypothetical protein